MGDETHRSYFSIAFVGAQGMKRIEEVQGGTARFESESRRRGGEQKKREKNEKEKKRTGIDMRCSLGRRRFGDPSPGLRAEERLGETRRPTGRRRSATARSATVRRRRGDRPGRLGWSRAMEIESTSRRVPLTRVLVQGGPDWYPGRTQL